MPPKKRRIEFAKACLVCGSDWNSLGDCPNKHYKGKDCLVEGCGWINKHSNAPIHARTHTGARPYHCDVCDYRSKQNGDLKKHMKIHTGDMSFKCDTCDEVFNQLSKLNKHKRTHKSPSRFTCDICDYSSRYLSNLRRHKRLCHRPFPCFVCLKKKQVEDPFLWCDGCMKEIDKMLLI